MIDNSTSEQEISLHDILDFLGRNRKALIGVILAAGIISAAVALSLPNVYTAKVRMVLPPSITSTGASTGTQGMLGFEVTAAQAKAVLESSVLADKLMQRFSLAQAVGVDTVLEARNLLMGTVRFGQKDGVFTIEVDDRDPVRAAMLANAYPEEFDRQIRTLNLSGHALKRTMSELRLGLLGAEAAHVQSALQEILPSFSRDAYIMEREGFIDNLSLLRAELDLIGEDLAALPVRRDNLETIHARLEQLKGVGVAGPGGRTAAEKEYLQRYGQVKYAKALAERLQQRLAIHLAEESVYGVRVVDAASPPTEKSKPHRTLIVLAAILATAFLMIVFLLLKEAAGGLRRQNA